MKLLEYLSPFSTATDATTKTFIFFIIVVLLFALIYTVIMAIKYKNFLKQQPEEVIQSVILKEYLWDYNSDLQEINNQKKNSKPFFKYIDQLSFINLFFNRRTLGSVSNLLVGIGILGTFCGLSIGVSGFDMTSTHTIQGSISNLLGGMGAAFVTSIWGMGASLIFTFSYQLFNQILLKRTNLFYLKIDEKYLMNNADSLQLQDKQFKEAISEVIEEYFVVEEEGQKLSPKYYNRELLINSRNQTQSLSSFADDLASILEDMMDKLLEINSEKFKSIIDEKLVPILEQLRKEKEESASGALEGILSKLEESMKDMLNDFKNSISGETKGEMNNLATTLGNVTESLNSLPQNVSNLSESLNDNMQNMVNMINDAVDNIQQERIRSEELRKQTQEDANIKLKSILDNAGQNVEQLLNQQSQSSDKFQEILEITEEVISKNNQSITSFSQLLNNSEQAFSNIQSTSKALTEASLSLSSGAKSVETNNKELQTAVQNFVQSNDQSIDKIRKLQTEINENTRDFLGQFNKMENGIDKVFEQFNNGLDGYTENLNHSLSSSIGKYVDSSNSAISMIHGLTQELSESIEELSSTMAQTR